MKYEVEHTDTFGGEANYSWVTRKEIEVKEFISDLALVRRAKAALEMTGVRCRKESFGEGFALYPIGCCQVIFITPVY